jgi:hypothetical protein
MEETTAAATETHRHDHGCLFCGVALPIIERLWPETTRDHFRNSRIEFLKGIRSLLDERIAQLSRKEPRGTKVAIE